MPTVVIPVIFRGPTRGESEIEVPAKTIGGCFDAVEAEYPGLRELVIDPDAGGIHRFVKVTLNGELLDRDPAVLEKPVSEGDRIEVIAAIAGG